jgi:Uma2 family endonuclease
MQTEDVQTYRFTREEYHRLGDAGILDEDDRVELLDGELIIMSPIGIRHIVTVRKLNRIFSAKLADRCIVDVQNPMELSEYSEPQPDILLIRLEAASLAAEPGNVLLIAEVAESSLGYDRGKKLKFYAAAGVQEVWIFNLLENVIEAHYEPAGMGYAEERIYKVGERISVRAFPETSFAVEELLP